MATYTLTTNNENIVGTTQGDTFNGTYDAAITDTFGANDSLNGGDGIDTLHLDHIIDVSITPPDELWTNVSNIENVELNTTGNGAITLTTAVNFETAFAAAGVNLTSTTSGTGALNITMDSYTGAANLSTTTTDGAQTIVTGSGPTTVASATSGAGAINIKGIGLESATVTTTGAGAQVIGDGSGNGANLTYVLADSAGGAQTIISTSTNSAVIGATSDAGQQVIVTGDGADTVTASTTSTNNTIDTNLGNDSITISPTASGSYTINSGSGNDSMTGGAGNDTLIGDIGDDILDGGAGVDFMSGDNGSDIYYVDIATDVVSETSPITSSGGIDLVRSSLPTYILTANVENGEIITTGTADLTGNELDNVLSGNVGNNVLTGDLGNDSLNGYGGLDTLFGGLGNDTYVVNGSGVKVRELTVDANEIDLVSSSITYTLGSNLNNLELTGSLAINGTGNTFDNVITGNSAANSLDGSFGNDTLAGGFGEDTYVIDSASDVISESSSDANEIDLVRSSVDYTLGTNLNNLKLVDSPATVAVGNALNNSITGNANANLIDGAAGDDILSGGLGNDTYVVDSTGDWVSETTLNANEIDLVRSSVNYTLSVNLENIKLIGSTAVDAIGNSANNNLNGNSAGNLLNGLAGADTLTGNLGDDTYVVDSAGDVVRETTADINEIDLVRSSISYTLGSNLNNLTLTGSTAIDGTGNALDNVINGNSAANLLDGSYGADTLTGGYGDDTYVVDSTGDVVLENSVNTAEIDLVRSTVDFTLGANLNNLKLNGSSAVQAVGNNLANDLNGNSAGNLLNGATGADTMTGSFGNDTYVVDDSGDVVVETTIDIAEIDLVRSSVTYTLGANLDNLTLASSRAINGTGNGLDNVITGDGSNNSLSGGYGADSLSGCSGNVGDTGVGSIDTLTGNFDADRFFLGNSTTAFYNDGVAGNGSTDYALITDFSPSHGDKLVLHGNESLYTLGAYDSNTGSQDLYLDNGQTAGSLDNQDELIAKISTGIPINMQQAIYQ